MHFMRILVMFDMPTKTDTDKNNYRCFRKWLLNNGYEMLQYSVYYRVVKGIDAVKRKEQSLQKNEPPCGSIICLSITERQYEHMHVLVGKLPGTENKLREKQLCLF